MAAEERGDPSRTGHPGPASSSTKQLDELDLAFRYIYTDV